MWQSSFFKTIKSHSFLIATAVVLVVYIALIWWLPKNVFWSPDEGAKFINMNTISWDNGPRFDIPYNGRHIDPGFQFYPNGYPRGHVYPQPSNQCNIRFNWLLWFPLLSLIPYKLFGIWGLYVLPLLCGWGTAVLGGVIARHIQPKAAVGTILAIGFATPILFYSVLFWEHTIAIFFSLLAVWLMLTWPQRTKKWPSFLGIGLAFIFATALRLETSVFMFSLLTASILVMWFQRKEKFSTTQVKQIISNQKWHFLVISAFLMTISWLLFVASPLQENTASSYCKADKTIPNIVNHSKIQLTEHNNISFLTTVSGFREQENWNHLPRLVNRLFLSEEIHTSIWLLIIGFTGVLLIMIGSFFKESYQVYFWVTGIIFVSLFVTIILLSGQRYRFVRGLFLPAPYLLLVIYFSWRKKDYSHQILGLTILIYFFLGLIATLLREDPNVLAGTEWGARYLLNFYPVATIGTIIMLVEMCSKITSENELDIQIMLGSALLMIGLSVFFNMRGLYELNLTKTDLQKQQAALPISETPTVSDLFWLPAALAPYYLNHEMYIINDPTDFQTWIERAAPHVRMFSYVSFTPPELPSLIDYDIETQSTQTIQGLHIIETTITAKK